jgi:hypothetical protein
MFREAAKTAISMAKALQWILYEKKKNILWIGCENEKSKEKVIDIGNEIIENEKIIFDFGKIISEEISRKNAKKQNTQSKFTTSTKITISAGMTSRNERGKIKAENRPDAYFIDDIENDTTKTSRAKTQKIINYLGELFSGADASAHFIILANRISKIGVVNFLEKTAERMPKLFQIFERKVIDDAGNPTWPAAWAKTTAEAREWNATHHESAWKKSIEEEREKLGEARFAQEFLNEPAGSGDIFHEENFNDFALSDSEKIKREMEVAIVIDPSFSTRAGSDFCPIVALGRHRWNSGGMGADGNPISLNRFYLLDGSAERYLPARSIDTAINMAFKWISLGYLVKFVSCEQVSMNRDQQDFIKNLRGKMRERGLGISFRASRPLKSEDGKKGRITDICGNVLPTGRFFVRCDDAKNNFWAEMRDQFLKFPLHAHDDIPDVVAQGIHEFEKKGNGEKAEQSRVNPYFSDFGNDEKRKNESSSISFYDGKKNEWSNEDGKITPPTGKERAKKFLAQQSYVNSYWN